MDATPDEERLANDQVYVLSNGRFMTDPETGKRIPTAGNKWHKQSRLSKVAEALGQAADAQAAHDARPEVQQRKARKHQRRMTVAGALVGGLVAGPIGAVALGVTENALNQPTPRPDSPSAKS